MIMGSSMKYGVIVDDNIVSISEDGWDETFKGLTLSDSYASHVKILPKEYVVHVLNAME